MKKNNTKNLVKSKKMAVQSVPKKKHHGQHGTKKVLASAFGRRFSDQEFSVAAAPRLLEKTVWSSPLIHGSGGALKALAKNVATHLETLNRPAMKRVVAQVIAERTNLGEVAEIKGHMYFARPDHINFTELIAQSKEAFDDLVQQRPPQGFTTERPPKTQAQTKPSRPTGGTSSNGVGLALMEKLLTNKPVRTQKPLAGKSLSSRITRFESPMSVFELDDVGSLSLNGVIIDDAQLPTDCQDILLEVSKRPRGASRAVKNRRLIKGTFAAQTHGNVLVKAETATPAIESKMSSQRINNQGDTAQGKLSLNSMLPAGAYHHPAPEPAPKKTKPRSKVKSKSKAGRKIPVITRNYSRPWLVTRMKNVNPNKRASRLTGGFGTAKKPQESKIETVFAGPPKNIVFPWYKPLKSQGGAEATQQFVKGNPKKRLSRSVSKESRHSRGVSKGSRHSRGVSRGSRHSRGVSKGSPRRKAKPVPSRTTVQKTVAKRKTQGKARTNESKNKKKSPAATAPAHKLWTNSLTTRKSRYNRLQARLIRDLKREEAIDEPERLKSGAQRRYDVAKQPENPAEPRAGRPRISKQNSPRSSPRKRLAKRIPAPLSARYSARSPFRSGSKSPTKIRHRRSRLVRVGSSLGSIELLGKPNGNSNKNSKTTLTPAKRHLTIAFFNKRLEERNKRQALTRPWK